MVTDGFQYVPFPIPEYLLQYFAYQANSKIHKENNLVYVPIDRHSNIGKVLIENLSENPNRVVKKTDGVFFIRVSNYTGNNYPGGVMGKRQFLKLADSAARKIIQSIKADFEESMISFVNGAEFAHKKNGWNPNQKKKGIRKHAILEFCKKHRVNTRKRTLEALFKMFQRHTTQPKRLQIKGSDRYVQSLSF